jgi:hypothetical protein
MALRTSYEVLSRNPIGSPRVLLLALLSIPNYFLSILDFPLTTRSGRPFFIIIRAAFCLKPSVPIPCGIGTANFLAIPT